MLRRRRRVVCQRVPKTENASVYAFRVRTHAHVKHSGSSVATYASEGTTRRSRACAEVGRTHSYTWPSGGGVIRYLNNRARGRRSPRFTATGGASKGRLGRSPPISTAFSTRGTVPALGFSLPRANIMIRHPYVHFLEFVRVNGFPFPKKDIT